jgi:hypothetical protein
LLWASSALNNDSTVVELGCGISGLIALSLAPSIRHYVLTDQVYIRKLLEENLESNSVPPLTIHHANKRRSSHSRRPRRLNPPHQHSISLPLCTRPKCNTSDTTETKGLRNVTFAPLDWELDSPSILKEISTLPKQESPDGSHRPTCTPNQPSVNNESGFDILLACDCIYNDALIGPFVQTCADICRFRPASAHISAKPNVDRAQSSPISEPLLRPTICIIAQQLRSADVFESWLQQSMEEFRVWRVKDEILGKDLRGGSGYVVHMLVLKEWSGY